MEEVSSRFEAKLRRSEKPLLIQEVPSDPLYRIKTGYQEFDRLVGGGIVIGSLNLIGGEPGVGKSTLLLQLSKQFADQGLVVLYICGEESVEQTSMRAKRLGISSERLYLYSEILFSQILLSVQELKPDILIIDSVQIVYKGEIPSSPGSVTQVKEIAMECMHLSKGQNITTFLIGHVTKSGDIAGPRVLEHIVDGVFEFEGDREHGVRLIRSIKNRFGPTDDVALFQMDEKGLKEVLNPSQVFLEERVKGAPGSVIIPTIEGTRPILVEVQALVAPSSFATSSRRSAGLDPKRLTLLLAVLEKKMAYQLHSLDVFVSIAGGIKISEPAIDLAILLAIASSYLGKAVSSHTIAIGEVGLGGEVRSVPRIESRLKEGINMGFKEACLSSKNMQGIGKNISSEIQLVGVKWVDEAIDLLLNSALVKR